MAYDEWINWYHGVDDTTKTTPDPDPDPTPDPTPSPVQTAMPNIGGGDGGMDPAMRRQIDTSIGRLKKRGTMISPIDFGTVKYASLNEALKAEGLGDRSGFFSGTEFKDVKTKDKKAARIAETAAGMDPNAFIFALPMGAAFGPSRQLQDPTGQFTRSIPVAGIFNPIASMAINQEFEELYKIKQFRIKNPTLTGKAAGFGFSIGGVNVYRRPGEVLYRGQLDKAGLDQQTARSMEQYISGTAKGKQVAQALLRASSGDSDGSGPDFSNISDKDRIILQTENGGYLLNGNFHFGSGIAAYGYDEDMQALAASVFSANGLLPQQQALGIARSWRNSAKGLPRNATAAEKLANLNAHIQAATSLHQSNVAAAADRAAKAQAAVQQQRLDDIAAARGEPFTPLGFVNENYYDDQSEEGPSLSRNTPNMTTKDKTGRTIGTESAFDNVDDDEGLDPDDYAVGGDIPEDEEEMFRGAPDGEEPMITGNELLASRGDESGFVERPPSEVSDEKSVADDKPMVAKEEGMVLNAEAVKIAGEQDVANMIKDAEDYVRSSGKEAASDDREATDIQISEGEVYISPQLADVIGRDRLRKINDRGIPKTEKKLQKAAKGGKVKGYQSGGDVGDDGSFDAIVDAQQRFAARFPGDTDQERVENARIEAQRIMEGLNAEDAMAITMIGEASILGDDGMEAVGHVINNRANSMYREYANQPTPVDVITRRLPGRDYQFNALEFRTLRKTLNEITSTEYGRRKFEQMRQMAIEIINGDREDITGGSLLFWNPATSTNQHIRDGLNDGTYEVAYTQGQGNRAHQFIRPAGTELADNTAASEFPTDIESGFMVPELPAEPAQPAPTQTVSSAGVTLTPPRQAPDTGFMSMGDDYP